MPRSIESTRVTFAMVRQMRRSLGCPTLEARGLRPNHRGFRAFGMRRGSSPPALLAAPIATIFVLMTVSAGCQSGQTENEVLENLQASVQRNAIGRVSSVEILQLPREKVAMLEQTLPGLASLERLTLHGPAVGNQCLTGIPLLRRLKSLDVSGTNINDAAILQIRDVQSLEALNLGFCQQVTDRTLELMRDMPKLIQLNLDSCRGLSNDGLSHLSSLKSLTTLSLEGTRISGQGIVQLQGCPIQRLYLGGTQMDDDGMRHLQRLPGLSELYVSDTGISDAGLDHLSKLPGLRLVALENTRVTEEGVNRLKEAFSENIEIRWGGIYMGEMTAAPESGEGGNLELIGSRQVPDGDLG